VPTGYKFLVVQGEIDLSSNTVSDPVVLIVDDEDSVADTYALRLQSRYETRTAYGGEEALETVDESVDAVLLDRRMPDIHGDDVLDEIRNRGLTCKVIMATAVDPDLNILEMDFDDYLCKPIFQETLIETLEKHLEDSDEENAELDEFFAIVSKLSVLEDEKTRAQLEESAEYERLKERADELGKELRGNVEDFDDILDTYRDIERGS
jgi:DNA-binding response OmpR family regulator